MCSLLFCVSSISPLNVRILFCSLLDKEPNVTLYAVTTTYASIFTSRTEECWYWTRLISRVQIRRIHRHDTSVSNSKPHITIQPKATENDFQISNMAYRKCIAQGGIHDKDKKDKM